MKCAKNVDECTKKIKVKEKHGKKDKRLRKSKKDSNDNLSAPLIIGLHFQKLR